MQNGERRAAIGISLKHSGHFFVVGSAGGSFLILASKAFIGITTNGDSDEGDRDSDLIAITVPGISITLPAIALQLIGIILELVIGISPES